MSLAVLKKVDTRRDVAERLMALNLKHVPLFAELDDLKEKLKVYAETDGKGYTEEFGEGRHVKVSSPSESKFKGIMPRVPAKRRAGGSPAAGAGLTPLAYLLQVMRDPNSSPDRRFEAAKAAAPLVHPMLFIAPKGQARVERTVRRSRRSGA